MSHTVAVIGAGGAGSKRSAAVAADGRSRLVSVCDVDAAAARRLASTHGAQAETDWRRVAEDAANSLVVVSTPHDQLATITIAALEAGKHVLCEKPLGRNRAEVEAVVDAGRRTGLTVRAGYNHRFHPAVEAASQAAASGKLGALMFVRGRYGHGGRPGYDGEWRADRAISGGGELLDQGAHLVDLVLTILGPELRVVGAHTATAFWDMEVEDNAFALLVSPTGQSAALHVSWTQWRNLFSLEVFGQQGYANVEGLGGSYGTERLMLGRRRTQGGAPEEEVHEFPGPDESWLREWSAFLDAVDGADSPGADAEDALRTVSCLQQIYDAASSGATSRNISENST